jgi:hypothetical protein
MKLLSTVLILACLVISSFAQDPIDIGSRLELFVDDYLIDEMSGDAKMILHHPTPQEVAIVHDEPWEGNSSNYHSVFKDGDRYRLYYMANHYTIIDGELTMAHPLYYCYAESNDGIHWRKPELGLIEFNGSKENNIMWANYQTDWDVQPGRAVIITINYDGDDLKYQWYIGKPGDISKPIAGATSNTLNTGPLNESTNFWVQITTNTGVHINSDTCMITVATSSVTPVHENLNSTAKKNIQGSNGNAFGPIFLNAVDAGHSAVFKDTNPEAPPDALYKAIRVSGDFEGLRVFKSANGIHWTTMSHKKIISESEMKIFEPTVKSIYFDSQNLAFWDSTGGVYRLYFRSWPDERRDIMMMTSSDFINWVDPVRLKYPGARPDHLYTNQIKPYYRAPHILVGFPTRFINRGWTDSTRVLPDLFERRQRAGPDVDTEKEGQKLHFSSAVTEAVFMTSRDGQTFKRWDEAFLRPGIERKDTWAYGNQYIAWQLVETKSSLEGAPKELSLYATEGYWTGTSNQLRRYTIRIDGFVSINAPLSGGELVTKPLVFDGEEMVINFSSSAAGGVQVEIQDYSGNPIEGFTLSDCSPVFGDSIERKVNWKGSPNLAKLAGKPVRLRFVCKDADLYSFRFRPTP